LVKGEEEGSEPSREKGVEAGPFFRNVRTLSKNQEGSRGEGNNSGKMTYGEGTFSLERRGLGKSV